MSSRAGEANGRLGEIDVLLMDVGEKERPLGDPPDSMGSWASKVRRSVGGGILKPENVIDDAFVCERVRLEFPNGEDGEPVITIGKRCWKP
ncbi:hypothetical protein AtNW77_Chr4g0281601 [Arabidopsis thaliana]